MNTKNITKYLYNKQDVESLQKSAIVESNGHVMDDVKWPDDVIMVNKNAGCLLLGA